MVTAVLDDCTARIDMTMFEDVNEKYGHLLQKYKLLIVEGTVSWDDFDGAYNIRAYRCQCHQPENNLLYRIFEPHHPEFTTSPAE